MIVEHYPHPSTKGKSTFEKKAPAVVITNVTTPTLPFTSNFHPSYYDKLAKERNITPEEYKRRDDIVRDLYRKCVYKWGDEVYARNYDDSLKYGVIVIDKIAYDYAAMGIDYEWPATDNPLILTCHMKEADKDTGELYNFFATVNFVSLLRPAAP